MIEDFPCPVCGHHSWVAVSEYKYLRDDGQSGKNNRFWVAWRKIKIVLRILILARPSAKPIHCKALTPYQRRRREVLFRVWFQNEEKISLKSRYCRLCGFMAYSPRPSDTDITDKYRYLKQFEPDIGGQAGHDAHARKLDLQRATRIYRECISHSGHRGPMDVLDYGGGNGKLMMPFVEKGHRCFIIDYNDNPVPGVKKIGESIRNYEGLQKFDLIICSHVLEHVSDIGKLINFLRDALKADGIIYAEVPQEIWAGLKIDADPVTHINYFTKNSFINLFLCNDLNVIESKEQISNYGSAYMDIIWILAKRAEKKSTELIRSNIEELLWPSRVYSLRKLYALFVKPKLATKETRAPKNDVRPTSPSD